MSIALPDTENESRSIKEARRDSTGSMKNRSNNLPSTPQTEVGSRIQEKRITGEDAVGGREPSQEAHEGERQKDDMLVYSQHD